MKGASFWKWQAAERTLALSKCKHEEMRNFFGEEYKHQPSLSGMMTVLLVDRGEGTESLTMGGALKRAGSHLCQATVLPKNAFGNDQ